MMKKLLSIVFMLLILLSGMQLSVATHFCGGQIAAIKWSVDASYASCGMPTEASKNKSTPQYAPVCCNDQIVTIAVDDNYSPSDEIPLLTKKSLTSSIINLFPQYHINENLPAGHNAIPPGTIRSTQTFNDRGILRL